MKSIQGYSAEYRHHQVKNQGWKRQVVKKILTSDLIDRRQLINRAPSNDKVMAVN